MPPSDDERFENYLKQFRPLSPEVLHIEKQRGARLRLPVLGVWAAAAVVLITVLFMMWPRSQPAHVGQGTGSFAQFEPLSNRQSLTLGSANALLARAPSFKAAVDQLAHRPQTKQLAEGMQSLLTVLSKEDTHL